MSDKNSVVIVYNTHAKAEQALKKLQKMRRRHEEAVDHWQGIGQRTARGRLLQYR